MKRTLSLWAICCYLLFSSRYVMAQPAEYRIYAVGQSSEISLAELIDSAADVDVLFFGEEHNDEVAHHLQDTIYTLLLDRYEQVTLSLEMFETDCQQVVDEYLGGYITEDRLIKDGRAWSNYTDAYHPLVESARDRRQQVIAANAPRRYVSMVSRSGLEALAELPKSARRYLPPLPIYTADTGYQRRFHEMMDGMGHSVGEEVYHAQCTWDASMAYSVFRHWRRHRGEKIFHLNGRFHTDHHLGTVMQLKRLHRKINIATISCLPVSDFDQPNWTNYTEQGDFIILSRESAEDE